MSQHTIVQVTKFVTSDRLDDGVNIIQVEIPTPGPGEVLIRLKLRPVNPTDVHTIAGTRPIGPHKLPLVPGSEGESSNTIMAAYTFLVASSRP